LTKSISEGLYEMVEVRGRSFDDKSFNAAIGIKLEKYVFEILWII
jgi:hypothetical protein